MAWKKTHGLTTVANGRLKGAPPTYRSWHGMTRRARDNPRGYEHVDMDPRWKSYEVFLADMGECPPGCSIDRIDGARGYWPDNCRWATKEEQTQNRKSAPSPWAVAYARGMMNAMSQKDIATVIGHSQGTVSRIQSELSKDRKRHDALPPLGRAYARGMRGLMSQRDIGAVLGCSHSVVNELQKA
jgi:hypothetical protein